MTIFTTTTTTQTTTITTSTIKDDRNNTNQSVKNPGRRYDQGHVHDHVYGGRDVYGEV